MDINVFGYENKVYPLYISKKSHTQTLNLLLITEEKKITLWIHKRFQSFNVLKIKRSK